MLSNFFRRFSSFTYLNITQFLGALNDNIYKLLIVYFLIQLEGMEKSHSILASTGAIFVLPFLLFSASSGTLADRYSKRNIIALTKLLELGIMMFGVLSFWFESKIGSYIVLFLLATQSAIFGPSKYGILPELVSTDKISKANGMMTSFTFLAIILGTFFASFLLDITGKDFIIAAVFCSIIALVGVFTSFCIEYTPPAGSMKKFRAAFFLEIIGTLKFVKNEPSLLAAVIGSAYFLFLGAFVQLNMIPFAVQSLHLTDVQGGYLFLLTAMGIGTGAMLSGKISGTTVELGIVPIAGLGIIITGYCLDFFSDHLFAVIPLVITLGLFGGMYEIPLDSFIQVTSPRKDRGRVVAATNFLSFFGVLCASGLLYLITEIFGLGADKGFSFIATITLVLTLTIGFQFFDYLTRFIGMLLSKIHFVAQYIGLDNIPKSPAVYVCTHTAWNDTLLLLGAQRRRMRFFIQHEQEHSVWMKRLYRLLRVVLVPPIEPLERNHACLKAIKNTLHKGISVCIFVGNEEVGEEIEKLKHSYSFCEILEETHYPIIPVFIEKRKKRKAPQYFKSLLRKVRIPATVRFGRMISASLPIPEEDEEESEGELLAPSTF